MRIKIALLFLLLTLSASAANPELYLRRDDGGQNGAELAFETSPQWYLRLGANYNAETKHLSVPVSLLYKVPGKVILWSFYGGAGISLERESEEIRPYLVGGTEFLFLYSECLFSMEKNSEPILRGGFHFRF